MDSFLPLGGKAPDAAYLRRPRIGGGYVLVYQYGGAYHKALKRLRMFTLVNTTIYSMLSTFPPQYIVYVENLLKTLWKTLRKCGKLGGKRVEMLKKFSTNYPQIVEKPRCKTNNRVKLCKFT